MPRIGIKKNGVRVSDRRDINLVEGTGIAITAAEAATGVDIQFDATGGTGDVATDAIWDAAGDLAQGTGPNAAEKLAITVPAANILNVPGVVNGETKWSVKPIHDATAPAALGAAAAAGTAVTASHRDHVHLDPTIAHAAAADPHTGYVLESLGTGKGVLISFSAASTPSALAPGADYSLLVTDSAQAAGMRWAEMIPADQAMLPTGAIAETYSRSGKYQAASTILSARLMLYGIYLPLGKTITSISFTSGQTAGATLVNQWFGLFNSSGVPLRLTGDDTSTAWAADVTKTLNLSSTFVTTYAGLHYLGICVKATTTPNIMGSTESRTSIYGFAPALALAADQGLTDPASCPNPANLTVTATNWAYAYCS